MFTEKQQQPYHLQQSISNVLNTHLRDTKNRSKKYPQSKVENLNNNKIRNSERYVDDDGPINGSSYAYWGKYNDKADDSYMQNNSNYNNTTNEEFGNSRTSQNSTKNSGIKATMAANSKKPFRISSLRESQLKKLLGDPLPLGEYTPLYNQNDRSGRIYDDNDRKIRSEKKLDDYSRNSSKMTIINADNTDIDSHRSAIQMKNNILYTSNFDRKQPLSTLYLPKRNFKKIERRTKHVDENDERDIELSNEKHGKISLEQMDNILKDGLATQKVRESFLPKPINEVSIKLGNREISKGQHNFKDNSKNLGRKTRARQDRNLSFNDNSTILNQKKIDRFSNSDRDLRRGIIKSEINSRNNYDTGTNTREKEEEYNNTEYYGNSEDEKHTTKVKEQDKEMQMEEYEKNMNADKLKRIRKETSLITKLNNEIEMEKAEEKINKVEGENLKLGLQRGRNNFNSFLNICYNHVLPIMKNSKLRMSTICFLVLYLIIAIIIYFQDNHYYLYHQYSDNNFYMINYLKSRTNAKGNSQSIAEKSSFDYFYY